MASPAGLLFCERPISAESHQGTRDGAGWGDGAARRRVVRNKPAAPVLVPSHALGCLVTATAPLIDLAQQELETYRRSGRPVHLAHAARALNKALAAVRDGAPPELVHVGTADESR